MSALTDALAKIQQIHDNEQALADPVGLAWSAQMTFYQALIAAVESGVATAQPAEAGAVDLSAELAARPTTAQVLQLLQGEIQGTLPQIEQQIAASFGKLLAAQTPAPVQAASGSASAAEPSSAEPATIAPSNPA